MECRIQNYFDEYDIRPLTIVYEDFVKDYVSTVLNVLAFLGLSSNSVEVKAPFYNKTADDKSEIWVERF